MLDKYIAKTGQGKFFEENGFTVFRSLLPKSALVAFNEYFDDQVVPFKGDLHRHHNKYGPNEFIQASEGSNQRYISNAIRDAHFFEYTALPDFKKKYTDLICNDDVFNALQSLDGEERYTVCQSLLFLVCPQTGMHIDAWSFESHPVRGRAYTLWMALEDFELDDGSAYVLPNPIENFITFSEMNVSEPAQEKERYHVYHESLHNYLLENRREIVTPTVRAGDVIVWGSLTPHGSHPPKGVRSRRSMQLIVRPTRFEWGTASSLPSDVAAERKFETSFNEKWNILHHVDRSAYKSVSYLETNEGEPEGGRKHDQNSAKVVVEDSNPEKLRMAREQLNVKNYDRALDHYVDFIKLEPVSGWRAIVREHSGDFSLALAKTERVDELASLMQLLYPKNKEMIVLVDASVQTLEQVQVQRAKNIDKGLLPALYVQQPGSEGSLVSSIFSNGFNMPSVTYSVIDHHVVPEWAEEYARGGASYTTFLQPTKQNISILKNSGLNKLVVHVRDPRELFMDHLRHIETYKFNYPHLTPDGYHNLPLLEKFKHQSSVFEQYNKWISGWLHAKQELEILFTTYEEMIQNYRKVTEYVVDFYGCDVKSFQKDEVKKFANRLNFDAMAEKRRTWREELPPTALNYLTDSLPEGALQKFGWQN